jgi:hypothetical protein
MKLGIAYNVFDDSIELLKQSILTVRDTADYIVAVYQTVSNDGYEAIEPIEEILVDLKKKNLIDRIILFNPATGVHPHYNEVNKRNIGLVNCRLHGCTHHMSMDCDEFYISDELKYVKHFIANSKFDASVCQLQTYWKTSEYVLVPPEDYYVPLIYRITDHLFALGNSFPVLVDPTRRIIAEQLKVFSRNLIEMHHMTAVRRNYERKLRCSSAVGNFRNRIAELLENWQNWQYPQPALMPGKEQRYFNISKVNDVFKVRI